MDNDALEMKEILDKYKVQASGLSAHTPLMKPEISVPYLRRAIRFGAEIGVSIINTDEGPKPDWMQETQAFNMMEYTLTMASQTAERYGAVIGIEPHQIYSKTTEGLLRIANLVHSRTMRINYDLGNAFLGGADPYAGLEAVKDRVVHIHAKDISFSQAEEERGKVTGTPVGCACGEGVIDWEKVVAILKSVGYDGVLSVECGTIDQAVRSLEHLKRFL
jgi:sugar phosphate isomerase/epimerase